MRASVPGRVMLGGWNVEVEVKGWKGFSDVHRDDCFRFFFFFFFISEQLRMGEKENFMIDGDIEKNDPVFCPVYLTSGFSSSINFEKKKARNQSFPSKKSRIASRFVNLQYFNTNSRYSM